MPSDRARRRALAKVQGRRPRSGPAQRRRRFPQAARAARQEANRSDELRAFQATKARARRTEASRTRHGGARAATVTAMKVLYGVTGEGMGHAMRSRVVLEHLIAKGHTVEIMASGRAAAFL